MECHAGYPYLLQDGYPKTLSQEYGPTVPAYVTSAAYDEDADQFIYLFCENTVYQYDTGGVAAPGWSYTFVQTFDFAANALENVFSVTGPQTTAPYMAQPPSNIRGMYINTNDDNEIIIYAWKSFNVYRFYANSGEWEDLGTMVTPCG